MNTLQNSTMTEYFKDNFEYSMYIEGLDVAEDGWLKGFGQSADWWKIEDGEGNPESR